MQKQKVLRGGSSTQFWRDYGIHTFSGYARQGQSLEEVKNLLLGEIEKVKKGEFADWLVKAVINDLKLQRIRSQESNYRVFEFIESFIQDDPRADYLKYLDDLSNVTKDQLVKFAQEHYKNNYVAVYKKTGKDTTSVKVDKPPLTPVGINRAGQSQYYTEFVKEEPPREKPVFVDYKKSISVSNLESGVEMNYIENKTNELFSLYYIIDMGKNNIKKLPLAVNYLPFLGTDKYSPAQLREEFYKLGVDMNVFAGEERTYVYISGLEANMEKAVELLEHVLSHVKPDQATYDEYVKGLLKKRNDLKLDKYAILWDGLYNYGMYGKNSPTTNVYSETELKAMNPKELTDLLKEIYSYKHKIFYYGQNTPGKAKSILGKYHKVPATLKDYPAPEKYPELETATNKVYFVNYDMVQANIILLAKDIKFDKNLIPEARLFGEFYGSGLSSIVFQEIRESKALAYSAFSSYTIPDKPEKSHYSWGFVATQADKLKIATDAMLGLMNNMPDAEKQFNIAKDGIMKKIESERIIKSGIFWSYLNNKDLNINYDNRKDIYEKMKTINLDQFRQFFDQHIKGKGYTFLIIGDRKKLDQDVLKKLGEYQELKLEDIFNY